MGSAAAWALSERGADVTVYEQFDSVDHERGSSHGRTRIYRLAYPHAHWVRLMEEALEGWDALGGDVLQEVAAAVSYTHLTLPTICSV